MFYLFGGAEGAKKERSTPLAEILKPRGFKEFSALAETTPPNSD